MKISKFRKTSKVDENELLDEIGLDVFNNMEWTYGILPDDKRSDVSNHVVGFLYNLLCSEVGKLEHNNVAKAICFHLEVVI